MKLEEMMLKEMKKLIKNQMKNLNTKLNLHFDWQEIEEIDKENLDLKAGLAWELSIGKTLKEMWENPIYKDKKYELNILLKENIYLLNKFSQMVGKECDTNEMINK